MEVKTASTVPTSIDVANRTVHHVVSTDDLDRDSEVLLPRGCDASAYFRTGAPVFLNHRSTELPIGRCLSLTCSDDGHRLDAVTQFAGEKQGHTDAERCYRLVCDGFLNSFSVGFTVDEVAAERRYPHQQGRTIKRWSLVEVSLVGLPSNTYATVRLATALGLPPEATPRDLERAMASIPAKKYWSLAGPIARDAEFTDLEREAIIETFAEVEAARWLRGR